MSQHALPEDVINAFHLMWGNFPEPTSLVHKSREVMAINKAYEKIGGLTPGMNCAKTGNPETHKLCLANKALATGEATYYHVENNGKDLIAFWVPLTEYPEYFVHFGVGKTINFKEFPPAPRT